MRVLFVLFGFVIPTFVNPNKNGMNFKQSDKKFNSYNQISGLNNQLVWLAKFEVLSVMTTVRLSSPKIQASNIFVKILSWKLQLSRDRAITE